MVRKGEVVLYSNRIVSCLQAPNCFGTLDQKLRIGTIDPEENQLGNSSWFSSGSMEQRTAWKCLWTMMPWYHFARLLKLDKDLLFLPPPDFFKNGEKERHGLSTGFLPAFILPLLVKSLVSLWGILCIASAMQRMLPGAVWRGLVPSVNCIDGR